MKALNAVFASLLVVVAACATASPAVSAAAAPDTNDPVARMHALFASAWERDLRENPLLATYQGDSRYNDRWPDVSQQAIDATHRGDVATLAELRKIERAALPAAEQLNYDLFAREYEQRLRTWQFKPWLYAINHQGGIQTLHETAEQLPFNTLRDYEDWLARLTALGAYVDQNIRLLEVAAKEGRTQPKVIMQRVPAQIAAQIVERADDSPFFGPFKRMPETLPAADRERLSAAARAAISTTVIPAYRRLQKHFNERYLPATRQSVGISDTPQGAEFYRERIAYHTTLGTLTADEIHDIGLAEVARIRAEMQGIMQKVGYRGTFPQFIEWLRTDPQFFYKDGRELFAYESLIDTFMREHPDLAPPAAAHPL